MQTELFGVDDARRMQLALAVRMRVFVEEQHVRIEEEIDVHDRDDRDAVHAIVLNGEHVVGAGRFYVRDDGRTVKIGRMAILEAYRSRGAGRLLLNALMDAARQRGYVRASLSAQIHARAFYVKSGFVAEGALFEDAGITHQEMIRDL